MRPRIELMITALTMLLGLAAPWTVRAQGFPEGGGDPALSERPRVPTGEPPALFRNELSDPETLGIGRVAKDVASELPKLDALARLLEPHAAELGYRRVRPVIARDNAEMVEFLKRGIVDVLSETPLSALEFEEKAGAAILLRERRRGRDAYSSVLVVREDSGIRELADLRGRRVAFEDRGSTTACLLPLAAFRRENLMATLVGDSLAKPPKDAIAYYFTKSEAAILGAVSRGLADAGAVSSEDWDEFRHEDAEGASKLRILYESPSVPRAFLMTGPSVTPQASETLRKLLLQMTGEVDGREALERYAKIDRFDTIEGTLPRELAELRATWALVSEVLP